MAQAQGPSSLQPTGGCERRSLLVSNTNTTCTKTSCDLPLSHICLRQFLQAAYSTISPPRAQPVSDPPLPNKNQSYDKVSLRPFHSYLLRTILSIPALPTNVHPLATKHTRCSIMAPPRSTPPSNAAKYPRPPQAASLVAIQHYNPSQRRHLPALPSLSHPIHHEVAPPSSPAPRALHASHPPAHTYAPLSSSQ